MWIMSRLVAAEFVVVADESNSIPVSELCTKSGEIKDAVGIINANAQHRILRTRLSH